MSLGVLGYAGQAAIGMDESARRRRAREEEEMKLAQQRRAESEAQRMAALEAFARRDISSTPIPQAPAGLAIPMGTAQPQSAQAKPKVAESSGEQAQRAYAEASGMDKRLLGLIASGDSQSIPSGTLARLYREYNITPPTRAGLLTAEQAQRAYATATGADKRFLSLVATGDSQSIPRGTLARLTKEYGSAPPTVSPQAGILTQAQAQRAIATAEPKDKGALGLIASGDTQGIPKGTLDRLTREYGGVRTPEAKQAEQQVVNTAKQQQQQVAQQIAAETTPPQFYSTNPARLPEDYQMAIQQRERLVQLAMQYQNNPATAELYQGYLTKIADVDATLRSMLQSQAIEVFRAAGDPTYLAGELTKKYGRQVQITPLPEGRYQVMIQGGRKPYVADTAKLVEDSMGLFSEEYRQAQIDIRNKLALEQMKSALRMDEKEFEVAAEAILSGKVEAIKASFKDDARVVRDPMTQKEVVFVMKGGRMFFVDPQSTRVNPMTGQTSLTQKPSIVEVTTPGMN